MSIRRWRWLPSAGGWRRYARRRRVPAISELVWFGVVLAASNAAIFALTAGSGDFSAVLGADVPAAAVAFVCPAVAAAVVSVGAGRRRGFVRRLARRPPCTARWVIAGTAMPLIVAIVSWASAGAQEMTGGAAAVEPAAVSGWHIVVVAALYLLSATGEQIGWMGFVFPRLRILIGTVAGAALVGLGWAVVHLVPYLQAGRSGRWVIGQSVFTVAFAVVLGLLTERAGGSIWWAVLAHGSYNTAWTVLSAGGLRYDPFLAAALTAAVAYALGLAYRTHTPHQDAASSH